MCIHPHGRQVKVLQLHVSWRWLRLWFRRMKYVLVDFRVDDRAVSEVVSGLMVSGYNQERGPLWRARMVPLPAPPGRHRAVLVLAVQHTITDGLTNMVLSRDLLHLINATLLPQGPAPTLSPNRPIVSALSDTLVKPGDWPYIISFLCKKMSTSILTSKNKTIYFGGAMPCPTLSRNPSVPPLNRLLHTELSVATTAALLVQCRAKEVTVHALLLAVAQVAMVRVAGRRGGVDVAGTAVTICNCVNSRRYLPAHLAHAPGCFISLEDREIPASSDDEADVWGLAMRVHTSLRHSLGPGRIPVKNIPLLRMITLMVEFNRTLGRYNRPHRCDSHMVTTNMGNLSNLLPGNCPAGPVQVAHMVRTVSSELSCTPYMLASHTFRGRLLLSLDYYTTKTTPAAASQVFHCLVSMLTCLGNHGSITHDRQEAVTCPNAHHDETTFTYATAPHDYHVYNSDQYFTFCEDDQHEHDYDKHNYTHDHNHNQQVCE